MSTALLQNPATPAAPQHALESLVATTEKLAALRFFILITARRRALESADREASEQMRSDLEWLRAQYHDMVDEIAMRHGVQQAMDAQREVERGVSVPRDWPPMEQGQTEEAWF